MDNITVLNTLNFRYLTCVIFGLQSSVQVTDEVAPALENIIKTLDRQQQDVLNLRYGLYSTNGAGMTLEQIGKRFNLTHERIRQIEQSALRRLRHPTRSSMIRKYITVKSITPEVKPC